MPCLNCVIGLLDVWAILDFNQMHIFFECFESSYRESTTLVISLIFLQNLTWCGYTKIGIVRLNL